MGTGTGQVNVSGDGQKKMTREVVLANTYGMHVRPAHLFAKLAASFKAEIMVEKDGNAVSGKSIMGLMTLEAPHGTRLRIIACGEEAGAALDELAGLVARKFDVQEE